MFKHIMMPVDLGHADKLDRAMTVAADLAKHYGADITFVGVTSNAPGSVARTPEEYREKLAKLAAAQAELNGIETKSHAVFSHDPAVDLDDKLIEARKELGADLVVMATHLPNMGDMFLPSHGGELARHSDVSVFLVRHA
ncbi:universal stress protein [Salibaculum griseiflavum]|uniref:Universal stress protein UspA n=1 Tax=Salibaculum griseiflavum TaxID=1914409 RepID=A0A2V1P4J5_9RHOB|nr:universal stress protein [Salibaculum griseiflavum]PWG17421.1 universal stress protein UspA [Salibaculum griseiflavum]